MTLRDISQPLRPGVPIWPGDTAYAEAVTWAHGPDCPVQVAAIHLSTHSGTHADAPLHYDPSGESIGRTSLTPYIGPARVIDARSWGPVITPGFLAAHMADAPSRILFRTWAAFPHNEWRSNFTTIHRATIELLAARGVVLIGVDAPSLDPETSKTMDAHLAVRSANMRILEGLVLDDVPAGDYELIALPLSLQNLDASPVRAILRDL